MDAEGLGGEWDEGFLDGEHFFFQADLQGLGEGLGGALDQCPGIAAGAEASVILVAAIDEGLVACGEVKFFRDFCEPAVGWAVEDGAGLNLCDGGDQGGGGGLVLVCLMVEGAVGFHMMEGGMDGEEALELAVDEAADFHG